MKKTDHAFVVGLFLLYLWKLLTFMTMNFISINDIDPALLWFIICECIGLVIVMIDWVYTYSIKWQRRILDVWIPIVVLLVLGGSMFIEFEDPNIKSDVIRLAGSIGAVVLGLWVYRFQRRLLLSQIVDRVSGELAEIHRHLGANIVVLKNIDSSNGIPSLLHIRKLEITKYSSLSDNDVLKNLNQSHNKIIFPMTVRIRNYNINVQEIVDYLQVHWPNEKIFNEYKQGIIEVTENLRTQIQECLDSLQINIILEENKSDTKKIIYDKNW